MTFQNLDELRDAMLAKNPDTLDEDGGWRYDFPTFGGAPNPNWGGAPVWSWDEERFLAGDSPGDLEILNRSGYIGWSPTDT